MEPVAPVEPITPATPVKPVALETLAIAETVSVDDKTTVPSAETKATLTDVSRNIDVSISDIRKDTEVFISKFEAFQHHMSSLTEIIGSSMLISDFAVVGGILKSVNDLMIHVNTKLRPVLDVDLNKDAKVKFQQRITEVRDSLMKAQHNIDESGSEKFSPDISTSHQQTQVRDYKAAVKRMVSGDAGKGTATDSATSAMLAIHKSTPIDGTGAIVRGMPTAPMHEDISLNYRYKVALTVNSLVYQSPIERGTTGYIIERNKFAHRNAGEICWDPMSEEFFAYMFGLYPSGLPGTISIQQHPTNMIRCYYTIHGDRDYWNPDYEIDIERDCCKANVSGRRQCTFAHPAAWKSYVDESGAQVFGNPERSIYPDGWAYTGKGSDRHHIVGLPIGDIQHIDEDVEHMNVFDMDRLVVQLFHYTLLACATAKHIKQQYEKQSPDKRMMTSGTYKADGEWTTTSATQRRGRGRGRL